VSDYGIVDEALVFRDEATFFRIVQTTPDWDEAEDLLQRARTAAIRCKVIADRRDDLVAVDGYNGLLARINAEIKRVHKKQDKADWRQAVLALYGQEGLNRCIEWILHERREAA